MQVQYIDHDPPFYLIGAFLILIKMGSRGLTGEADKFCDKYSGGI